MDTDVGSVRSFKRIRTTGPEESDALERFPLTSSTPQQASSETRGQGEESFAGRTTGNVIFARNLLPKGPIVREQTGIEDSDEPCSEIMLTFEGEINGFPVSIQAGIGVRTRSKSHDVVYSKSFVLVHYVESITVMSGTPEQPGPATVVITQTENSAQDRFGKKRWTMTPEGVIPSCAKFVDATVSFFRCLFEVSRMISLCSSDYECKDDRFQIFRVLSDDFPWTAAYEITKRAVNTAPFDQVILNRKQLPRLAYNAFCELSSYSDMYSNPAFGLLYQEALNSGRRIKVTGTSITATKGVSGDGTLLLRILGVPVTDGDQIIPFTEQDLRAVFDTFPSHEVRAMVGAEKALLEKDGSGMPLIRRFFVDMLAAMCSSTKNFWGVEDLKRVMFSELSTARQQIQLKDAEIARLKALVSCDAF